MQSLKFPLPKAVFQLLSLLLDLPILHLRYNPVSIMFSALPLILQSLTVRGQSSFSSAAPIVILPLIVLL